MKKEQNHLAVVTYDYNAREARQEDKNKSSQDSSSS